MRLEFNRWSRRGVWRLARQACCAVAAVLAIAFCHGGIVWAKTPDAAWSVERSADSMEILLDEKPFAEYWLRDATLGRPYFANVTAPSGVRITRNFPIQAEDPQDHEKIHPGLWMAFGDLSGADNWRLKAPVDHAHFVAEPAVDEDSLTFAVENIYRDAVGGEEICREHCRYEFRRVPEGVLVLWDSTFRSEDGEFVFGDQEEMGLGVRLNGVVAVAGGRGGRILNSNGQRNEAEAWSKQADWCDYSGIVEGESVGVTIMPHPDNFRQAWCHCRDNGFMAMNPFGRNAFTGGEKSAVKVAAGEDFRLRYGVLFHWGDGSKKFDPTAGYKEYVHVAKEAR